ncbi:hypothetical protein FQA39_LY05145 [Lamprigera yunnana]|nr:hypothetical protein FQA39_LY05145 [Lamprigera yunnana]
MIQCGTRINGKLDYYGRKIDNIEKSLSKLEVQVKVELEKITDNINNRNFKEDISKERVMRNIDTVYEKINHKLTGLQGQTDVSNLKIKNIGETIIAKLDKIEESLTIRDSDMEAELTDAITAIDDLKTTCTNYEEATMNIVKTSSEKILKESEDIKKNYKQLEKMTKNISENVVYVQETVDSLLNQTTKNTDSIQVVKTEVLENLNEYANKFTDIHSTLRHKTDSLSYKLQQISNTTNLSRNEQQNSLRALMVQFGRLSGKEAVQNDVNNKLEEISKKVDTNFEDILLTQNLFLESCHRVQMDEAQIESQISVVLNKLIDIFENKTSINAKDIKQLEHMIKMHDSTMKRNVQKILNNLKEVLQKVLNENTQIVSNFSDQKQNLEIVHILLKDILNSKNPTLLDTILKTIQNLQNIIEKPQLSTHNDTIQLLNNIQQELLQQNFNNLNISNVIKNINSALNGIETKINNYFVNKNNAEVIASAVSNHLRKHFKPNNETVRVQNISDLITEIFGKAPIDDDRPIIFRDDLEYFNATQKEIETAILQCNVNGVNCKKIYNNTYGIIRDKQSDYTVLNCLPHYTDLIDVRFSVENEILNCSLMKSSQTDDCLPNYLDLIDVRFNAETFTKCAMIDVTTEQPCLPNYLDLIDVRYTSKTTTPNCTKAVTEKTPVTYTTESHINFIETTSPNKTETKDKQVEIFRVNLMTTQRNVNKDIITQQEVVSNWYDYPDHEPPAEEEDSTSTKSVN